jgi:hypothetical protein
MLLPAQPADRSPVVATFWRYIRIQLMIFVFGCVGPIFLVIFFATQPDPSTKFFYWAGLFITAADVLIALGLTSSSDPNKAPVDARVALALAKRRKSSGSSDQSSSSVYDPAIATHFVFNSGDSSSSDSGSSSDSSSSDSGSSSSSSD